MARWKLGESEIEALVAAGDLQKLVGAAANGERLLAKASITLATARSAVERDPDSAFVLAYDAFTPTRGSARRGGGAGDRRRPPRPTGGRGRPSAAGVAARG